jgi:hypothetical protein
MPAATDPKTKMISIVGDQKGTGTALDALLKFAGHEAVSGPGELVAVASKLARRIC